MTLVDDLARAARAAQLARERAAAVELVKAYAAVRQRLASDLKALTDQIAARKATGQGVSAAWLYRQDRYKMLLRQVEAEVSRVSGTAGTLITSEQRLAVQAGQTAAQELLAASLPGVAISFNRLPVEAVSDLVGTLADGTPMADLLAELGPQAASDVKRALVTGLATGEGPRALARGMRDALGGNLQRALLISRTEVLRSYRESSRQTYLANIDVVKGWRWSAAKSVRTCLNCLSRDGKLYALEKPMPAHPACRCSVRAETKTFRELGIDVPEADRGPSETGAQWFARQGDDVKLKMMGPRAFAALDEGRVRLSDFEGLKHSARWGDSSYQRSLREILAS